MKQSLKTVSSVVLTSFLFQICLLPNSYSALPSSQQSGVIPAGSSSSNSAYEETKAALEGPSLLEQVSQLLNVTEAPAYPAPINNFAEDVRKGLASGYSLADPQRITYLGVDYYQFDIVNTNNNAADGSLVSLSFKTMLDANSNVQVLFSTVLASYKNVAGTPNIFSLYMGLKDLDNALDKGAETANNPWALMTKINVSKIQNVSSDVQLIYFDYLGESYTRISMYYDDPNVTPDQAKTDWLLEKRGGWIHFANDRDNISGQALVLAFHGGYGTGAQMMVDTGMNTSSDASGYTVVYLDGYLTTWNAILPGTPAADKNLDDVGFVDTFLDWFVPFFQVDENKLYATGISNGGKMAYRLADESRHTFAAIAVVASGIMQPSDYTPTKPTPILVIHGTQDWMIPYLGGIGPASTNPQDYMAVESELVPHLLSVNGNSSGATVLVNNSGYVQTVWGSGANQIELIKVIGGGHTWPGGYFASFLGNTSQAINANETIWSFFTTHVLMAADTVPPTVQMNSPATVNLNLANSIRGQVDPITGKTLYKISFLVDGVSQDVWVPLSEGNNNVSLTFKDAAENATVFSTTITLDTIVPILGITSASLTNQKSYVLTYTVDGVTKQESVALSEGANTITRTATDTAGNVGTQSWTVTLDTVAPKVTLKSSTSFRDSKGNYTLRYMVDGVTYTEQLTKLPKGKSTITRNFTDAAGNKTSVSWVITRK